MKVANAEQMRGVDQFAINTVKIPGVILMENAAISVLKHIYQQLSIDNVVTVICGTGNNGGDGFVISRHLYLKGIDVNVVLIGDENNIKGDAKINYDILVNMNIPITRISNEDDILILASLVNRADIVVDSIFGTGLTREIVGYRTSVIDVINQVDNYVVAVDIPSGVCSNTGRILGNAVKADKTVTFALPKTGLLLYPAVDYCGELITEDIGIPKDIQPIKEINTNTLTNIEAKKLMPDRKNRSNKGTFGKALVVAGSKDMTGAAILTAQACYRGGCGLVNLLVPRDIQKIVQHNIVEAITTPYDIRGDEFTDESLEKMMKAIRDATVIALGPGLGTSDTAIQLTKFIIENSKVPIVIDADALNIIANNLDIIQNNTKQIVVTPHVGEMSRLTKKEIKDISLNMVDTCRSFSKKYNVVCVLKDARTIISNPDAEIYINTTGNNGMSTAGSGDVLTGMITSLIAQGLDPFNAALLGVYNHGVAGDIATRTQNKYSLMASDICTNIGKIEY